MSLTLLTLILLIVAFVGWLAAEFRGRIWVRIIAGFGVFFVVAVMAFIWGRFAEGFSHAEFLEPHDSQAQTAQMDAADKSATNKLSR